MKHRSPESVPCGKAKLRNRLEAKIALARTYRSRSSCREEKRFYWCKPCKAYHLTKKG